MCSAQIVSGVRVMDKNIIRASYLALSILLTFASVNAIASSSSLNVSTEYAIAIARRQVLLRSESNYIFSSGTSLVFSAPEIGGWTFDHIDIDFGCEVGGVTGKNVSDIFWIDNGYIKTCQQG